MHATAHKFWNIAIALGLAVLAITLTTFYVANYKRHVQRGEQTVTVLVAAKDIPAGTPGADVIAQHMLTNTSVARREVVPGAISSAAQLSGLISNQVVYAGEQVTARRFGTPAERGVRSLLTGTYRAFELAGDQHQLLAGTLRSGDRVDVVATWAYPEGGQTHVSRVILRNLRVLAAPAGNGVESKLATTANDLLSAQLALTDTQSQKLEWASENAKWHFVLRPPLKSADSPAGVETSGTLVSDGVDHALLLRRLSTDGASR